MACPLRPVEKISDQNRNCVNDILNDKLKKALPDSPASVKE
jgi:hypothetical protein